MLGPSVLLHYFYKVGWLFPLKANRFTVNLFFCEESFSLRNCWKFRRSFEALHSMTNSLRIHTLINSDTQHKIRTELKRLYAKLLPGMGGPVELFPFGGPHPPEYAELVMTTTVALKSEKFGTGHFERASCGKKKHCCCEPYRRSLATGYGKD
jgi:hypothetical protein